MIWGKGQAGAAHGQLENGWFIQGWFLVLPGFTQLDRAGFSEDAGWGHPAYNRRFDSWTHVLVLAEPWPGIGFTKQGVW